MKFTYKRIKILLLFSIPIIILLLMLILFGGIIVQEVSFSSEYPLALGVYAFPFVLLIFLVFLFVKVGDLILTCIETDENGFYYKSLLKSVFIPWNEVLQVKRVTHLTYVPGGIYEYYHPTRPEDVLIQTRSLGKFRVINSLIKENEDKILDLFVQEVEKHTKWEDSEKKWKKNLLNIRAISMKIMGIGMFLIGIYFQIAKPSSTYEILNKLKDLTGIHWVTIFCFIFGIYFLIAKPRKP